MEKVDRRNFLKNLALAFTILPSAGRVWKASAKIINPRAIPNPAYATAQYEVYFFAYEQFPYTFHRTDQTLFRPTSGESPIIYRRAVAGNARFS